MNTRETIDDFVERTGWDDSVIAYLCRFIDQKRLGPEFEGFLASIERTENAQ